MTVITVQLQLNICSCKLANIREWGLLKDQLHVLVAITCAYKNL